MRNLINIVVKSLFLTLFVFIPITWADNSLSVPILTYHNFDPSTPGSMTLSTQKFEEQMQWLKDNGYTVIPLKDLVNYLEGKTASVPAKSVVVTADDGRDSVYKYMLPIVRKFNIPVTLFIYPSSISNASYAMTWEQLKELQKTGLFDIQGHTYWHPNFKQDKKRLSPADYQKFLQTQLVKSKQVLDQKLNINVTLLAWPFGIYDNELEQAAENAGYEMAFSIDARAANKSENKMAMPRYMIVAGQSMQTFASIIQGQSLKNKPQEN
jgi:peptidoglycan/xylan/chitin deacetylase (PgdA/CDA1 family)